MAPEWVIVLQTCTGRSGCSCCLLDAGVLTLTYIYTTRKKIIRQILKWIRNVLDGRGGWSTVSSERLRQLKKELSQPKVAQAAVTWLWFMWRHIWPMMMVPKMLPIAGHQRWTCSKFENSPQMDFRQRQTFLSPSLLPLTDGSFLKEKSEEEVKREALEQQRRASNTQ